MYVYEIDLVITKSFFIKRFFKKLKTFFHLTKWRYSDNAKIFAKTISALSNGDNARIVKSFKRRCEM